MIFAEDLKIIEREVKQFFEKLETSAHITVEQVEGKEGELPRIDVEITVAEPKMLIGEKGQTLFEVQHVLKLMLRRKIEAPFYLSLDVNDYKKNKEEYLQDLAKTMADEVVLLKKEKELPPMPASERRVVHMALAERSDVVSESVGEGPDRRIVIKLKT